MKVALCSLMFELEYELKKTLGAGGMGTVYLAERREGRTLVALKVLHEELAASEVHRARFQREVQLMGRLRSSCFARVLDAQTDAERPYFAMEYLGGRDLQARLGAGPMLLREAVGIGREIARAIRELHEAGIVHRDLKPSNIFLEEDRVAPSIKILDLGIAKLVEDPLLALTSTYASIGTMSHMAPEQFLDPANVGEPADVWALGVMLFEMLTGAHPFRRAGTPLPVSIVHETPTPLSDLRAGISPGLADLVYRALAKDPVARLSIDELERGLRRELAPQRKEISFGQEATVTETPALFAFEEPDAPDEATLVSSRPPKDSFVRDLLGSEDDLPTAEFVAATRIAAPVARVRAR